MEERECEARNENDEEKNSKAEWMELLVLGGWRLVSQPGKQKGFRVEGEARAKGCTGLSKSGWYKEETHIGDHTEAMKAAVCRSMPTPSTAECKASCQPG